MNQPALKITLTGIHYLASMSEETECFDATVNIDGKPAFIVSNRGNGGCDDHAPIKGQTYEQMHANVARVSEYARSLPPLKSEHGDLTMDLDLFLGGLFTDHLRAKDYQRLAKKNIVLIDGGKVYQIKLTGGVKAEQISESARQKLAAKYPSAEFLNWLPQDQAVAKYLAVGA